MCTIFELFLFYMMRSCLNLIQLLQTLSMGSIMITATILASCCPSNTTIESLPPATSSVIWEDNFAGD
jgi:hypothetical protein